MPRLWDETIETHRQAVRDAILDTTWALVERRGLLSVTMSQIAVEVGIGRATLYKYFPDVETILVAHHTRHVAAHLEHLTEVADQPGAPAERLEAVMREFARICHYRGRHSPDELVSLLHHGSDAREAQDRVRELFQTVLVEAVAAGEVRADIAVGALADYCLHALAAAGGAADEKAAEGLVTVAVDGLRARP